MPKPGLGSITIAALLAAGLLPAGTACNRANAEDKVAQHITVSKADHEKTFRVAAGGRVTVRLAWSPGTGYDWLPGNLDGSRLQMEGEPATEPNKEPMPGAPEIRIFQFKALKAGPATLELHSRRPWEKETPPAETFRIQLTIQ